MTLHFPDKPLIMEGDLPSFGSPPVTEMTMGILFEGLAGYNSILARGFWDKAKSVYPIIEEHPPLLPTFETFGGGGGAGQIQFELLAPTMQPRFFFVTDDRSELVQLQRDRMHFNWRRTPSKPDYPRYPALRQRFLGAWDILKSWTVDDGLGSVLPTQCEIAYVNNIPLTDERCKPCGLSHIFPWLSGLEGITEDGSFQFRRRLLGADDQPVGRMIFQFGYGTDQDGKREIQLMLTVRGRPASQDLDACMEFLDDGRKLIVHTFTGITSQAAHDLWSKE